MRYAGDTQDGGAGKTFQGTGNPEACLDLLKELVYKDPCKPKPCAIGAVYQPTLPPDMDFYAVGSFHYTLDAIDALDKDGRYIPSVGFEKAIEYCRKVSKHCVL